MGLGGVAIAVLPYVIHPKTAVLGRAGGGNFICQQLLFHKSITNCLFLYLYHNDAP